MRWTRRTTPTLLAALAAAATLGMTAPAGAETPRPGCGYGDDNHSHQAAPGKDPLGFRPGNGTGDGDRHTAPPGQAPDGAGGADDPQRGCKER